MRINQQTTSPLFEKIYKKWPGFDPYTVVSYGYSLKRQLVKEHCVKVFYTHESYINANFSKVYIIRLMEKELLKDGVIDRVIDLDPKIKLPPPIHYSPAAYTGTVTCGKKLPSMSNKKKPKKLRRTFLKCNVTCEKCQKILGLDPEFNKGLVF